MLATFLLAYSAYSSTLKMEAEEYTLTNFTLQQRHARHYHFKQSAGTNSLS
jgi:hypothetical protein